MNSKIIPHNCKDGVYLIPIAVHPSLYTVKKKVFIINIAEMIHFKILIIFKEFYYILQLAI